MRKILVLIGALAIVGCTSAQPLAVDLSPSAARGLKTSQQSGCASCHGADFGGGTGPTWQGIIGQSVAFKGGSSGVVDRDYLVESIKYPDQKLRVGYSVAMPYNNLTVGMTHVASGELQAMFISPTNAMPLVQAGRLRALESTTQ